MKIQHKSKMMYKEYRHKYPINCTEPGKIFVLILHYNGSNSLFSVNAVKIYQFKREDSKIKQYPLYLGNNSSDFTLIYMKERLKTFLQMIMMLLMLTIF